MLKNALLLSTLLLFVGCAERGYTLTTNPTTQTITAETVTSIKKESSEPKSNMLKKMTSAVKKALQTQIKTDIKPKKKKIRIKKKEVSSHIASPITKTVLPSKVISHNEPPILKEPIVEDDNQENTNEENRLKKEARKSKELREAKLREIMKFKELAKQKIKTPHIQVAKEINTNKAIETTTEKENLEKLKKEQEELAAKASLAEQKRLKNKMLQAKREKEQQRLMRESEKSAAVTTTKPLNFHQIDKVYHKFGTSEVHGHVIYLTPSGQETRLTQTKVYLLPISAKLNNWYNNYYLKNKSSANKTIVNYLNQTSLNLERNFEFFGVPEGKYYVVIEANYPSSMAKNKKVYIAKKIQVGKYKKIMGVFSKKL